MTEQTILLVGWDDLMRGLGYDDLMRGLMGGGGGVMVPTIPCQDPKISVISLSLSSWLLPTQQERKKRGREGGREESTLTQHSVTSDLSPSSPLQVDVGKL